MDMRVSIDLDRHIGRESDVGMELMKEGGVKKKKRKEEELVVCMLVCSGLFV